MNNIKKFGQPLGITKQNVIAFSNDEQDKNIKGKEIINYYNDIFTGFKYECVEFVRRWMIMVYNISFEDVNDAIDIYDLNSFYSATNPQIKLKIKKISNGLSNDISFGDLVIWKKQGYFNQHGHVAVVVKVSNNIIYIALSADLYIIL